jgi:hypothetical protein
MENVKEEPTDLKDATTDLVDHVEDLANTFYKLTVVNLTQKTSNITAGIIVSIFVGVMSFFVLLFSGIALSWWLGNLVDNRTLGFVLGAVFFLVVLLIVVMLKKQIAKPIRNFIIRKIYD